MLFDIGLNVADITTNTQAIAANLTAIGNNATAIAANTTAFQSADQAIIDTHVANTRLTGTETIVGLINQFGTDGSITTFTLPALTTTGLIVTVTEITLNFVPIDAADYSVDGNVITFGTAPAAGQLRVTYNTDEDTTTAMVYTELAVDELVEDSVEAEAALLRAEDASIRAAFAAADTAITNTHVADTRITASTAEVAAYVDPTMPSPAELHALGVASVARIDELIDADVFVETTARIAEDMSIRTDFATADTTIINTHIANSRLSTVIALTDTEHEFAGNGTDPEFTIPAGGRTITVTAVTVDGTAQVDPDDYSSDNNVVTFATAPAAGAVIIVTYDATEDITTATVYTELAVDGLLSNNVDDTRLTGTTAEEDPADTSAQIATATVATEALTRELITDSEGEATAALNATDMALTARINGIIETYIEDARIQAAIFRTEATTMFSSDGLNTDFQLPDIADGDVVTDIVITVNTFTVPDGTNLPGLTFELVNGDTIRFSLPIALAAPMNIVVTWNTGAEDLTVAEVYSVNRITELLAVITEGGTGIPVLVNDPATSASQEGDIWYNSTDDVIRYFDGTNNRTLAVDLDTAIVSITGPVSDPSGGLTYTATRADTSTIEWTTGGTGTTPAEASFQATINPHTIMGAEVATTVTVTVSLGVTGTGFTYTGFSGVVTDPGMGTTVTAIPDGTGTANSFTFQVDASAATMTTDVPVEVTGNIDYTDINDSTLMHPFALTTTIIRTTVPPAHIYYGLQSDTDFDATDLTTYTDTGVIAANGATFVLNASGNTPTDAVYFAYPNSISLGDIAAGDSTSDGFYGFLGHFIDDAGGQQDATPNPEEETFTGDGILTMFTLADTAGLEVINLSATVDGVAVDVDDLELDVMAGVVTVTFATAPGDTLPIVISYDTLNFPNGFNVYIIHGFTQNNVQLTLRDF